MLLAFLNLTPLRSAVLALCQQIFGGAEGLTLMVCNPYDKDAAHPGNGPMPAIQVDSRKLVDEVHKTALANGAKDEGAPGLRGPEGPQAFYGAYIRDLDGNKVAFFK